MDFVGRLSSEQKEDSPDDGGGGGGAEETGIISDVSEQELAITITTEGSSFLGKTAACSRSAMAGNSNSVRLAFLF